MTRPDGTPGLASGWLTQGPAVPRFEQAVDHQIEAFALAVNGDF